MGHTIVVVISKDAESQNRESSESDNPSNLGKSIRLSITIQIWRFDLERYCVSSAFHQEEFTSDSPKACVWVPQVL